MPGANIRESLLREKENYMSNKLIHLKVNRTGHKNRRSVQ